MPALQQAYEMHQADGLTILAINVSSQDTLAEAKAFVEELQLTMPVLLDEGSAAEDAYRLLGLPTTFFIDSQGVVTRVHFGPMDETQIETYIAEILPAQPEGR
jgi:peroxiredoxin